MDPAQLTSASATDPRWDLARRVADSSSFRRSPKLRAFLLYVCENALLGRPDNVREQLIGSKVFGRTADYNLSEDNIVRVEARELRRRLELYFADEGQAEPLILEIPKGGYLPLFRPRDPGPVAEPEPEAAEPIVPPPAVTQGGRKAQVLSVLCCVLVLTTVLAGVAYYRLRSAVPEPPGLGPEVPAEDYSLYADLLGSLGKRGRDTLVVLSNPKVVLYYGGEKKDTPPNGPGLAIPAPENLTRQFSEALNNADRNMPYHFLYSTRQDYTGMGEAVSAFHLGRIMQYLGRHIRLTQGRFLNWDHVQKEDLILLGAPQINDWTNQNIGYGNFTVLQDRIGNTNPLSGEQKEYTTVHEPGVERGMVMTTYGLMRMVTSPYGFRMLLIAGLSSAATGGTGEFFSTPSRMREVCQRIRAASPGKPFPSDWEAVIRLNIRDGFAAGSSLVAVRSGR